MTTIAYKDGILASDTLITQNWTRVGHHQKILRVDGWLLGGAGALGCTRPAIAWIKAGADLEQKIDFTGISDSTVVLISPKKKVYYSHSDVSYVVEEVAPYFALGSGADVARAAMLLGRSAIDAIRVGLELDTGSGGKPIWLSLDGREELSLPDVIYPRMKTFIKAKPRKR